ncbi:hypothetical protein POL68_03660 [Stigmatella sp. ncwal1]|uniref:Uncharacterized protein n=1 Tax=Stigmatella ashevillensis TaxID=2995309 RepID=A0ABT5D1L2_9BACT|nr:hypothetical protein [Stigmatella ashevillena]MDC0707557.1 hypothetical protein [Stigmatella ashevillena]
MDNASAVPNPQLTRPSAPQVETEEFKLEMLDCGPAYSFTDAGSVCISCACGSGCLCGCVSAPSQSA